MPRITKAEETNKLVWVSHPETSAVFIEFEKNVSHEHCDILGPARSCNEIEAKNILIRKWKWSVKDVELTEINATIPQPKRIRRVRTGRITSNHSNMKDVERPLPTPSKFGFLHGGNVVAPDGCTRAKRYDADDVPRAEACACAFSCQNAECSSYQKLMSGRSDRIKTQRTGETGDD